MCEWHQFQGLNVVIYSQYRQNFRACGEQKTRAYMRAGQLDYPPSIEHPRHFPRGRRLPGTCLHGGDRSDADVGRSDLEDYNVERPAL